MTRRATRPSKTLSPVGRNIKTARDARGITIDALALEIGVSPRLLQKWQQGAVQPRYDNLVKLAVALGHEPAWFFMDHDNEQVAA